MYPVCIGSMSVKTAISPLNIAIPSEDSTASLSSGGSYLEFEKENMVNKPSCTIKNKNQTSILPRVHPGIPADQLMEQTRSQLLK